MLAYDGAHSYRCEDNSSTRCLHVKECYHDAKFSMLFALLALFVHPYEKRTISHHHLLPNITFTVLSLSRMMFGSVRTAPDCVRSISPSDVIPLDSLLDVLSSAASLIVFRSAFRCTSALTGLLQSPLSAFFHPVSNVFDRCSSSHGIGMIFTS